ncbi:NXPE family member 3 [Biomphalaria pfeifferi]|uniref:NXPE family member 3 n=1 Tax=Biomphalaria pfeifferi TaxID=112525 RepID=A0AAD8B5S3_BIOPF|nr:NXPE family member 3 [Biomphalaria pfeifferi]
MTCTKINQTDRSAWHAPLRCENETSNISVSFLPHTFPFFGTFGQELNTSHVFSETRVLDSIPSRGKFIVHLHHFLHLAPFHLSVIEARLKLLREAIKRLLDRNPHVIILYQSAHSVYSRQTMNGVFFVELQRKILKGLGDRMMFVLTWPMTIAVDNDVVHPANAANFTSLYLGHVCGRLSRSFPV